MPTPAIIPGGGYDGDPIAGFLAVTVVEERGDGSQIPLSDVSVQLGLSAEAVACRLTTDAAGLALFGPDNCVALTGPQIVTAYAYGYAPATWFGVAGANVTVPLVARTPASLPMATASGALQGWKNIAPADHHRTVAVVGSTQAASSRAVEDPFGRILSLPATGDAASSMATPANVCIATTTPLADCTWRLSTRTGKQAHVAVLFDVDTQDTADENDDVATVTSMAWQRGLELQEGEVSEHETLEASPLSGLMALPVRASEVPAALTRVQASVVVELGDEGQLALAPQVLQGTGLTATLEVPRLEGMLSDATLGIVTVATRDAGHDLPRALVWAHDVAPEGAPSASSWLALPSALAAGAGSYSFVPASGAALSSVELGDAAGLAWSVRIFDGRTSFSLPSLHPPPLAGSLLTMKVSQMAVPGWIATGHVSLRDARRRLTALSQDQISFQP